MLVDRPKIQTAVGMLVVQKDGPHVRETIENPPMVNKKKNSNLRRLFRRGRRLLGVEAVGEEEIMVVVL